MPTEKTDAQIEKMIQRALNLFDRYEKAFTVDEHDRLIGKSAELYGQYCQLKDEILSWTAARSWMKDKVRQLL